MKKAAVTITFEQEKLKAVQFYMSKKDTSLDAELDEFVARLYEKFVPAQTREYIESMAEQEPAAPARPRRTPRPGGTASAEEAE